MHLIEQKQEIATKTGAPLNTHLNIVSCLMLLVNRKDNSEIKDLFQTLQIKVVGACIGIPAKKQAKKI